jgi:hypothetical protein
MEAFVSARHFPVHMILPLYLTCRMAATLPCGALINVLRALQTLDLQSYRKLTSIKRIELRDRLLPKLSIFLVRIPLTASASRLGLRLRVSDSAVTCTFALRTLSRVTCDFPSKLFKLSCLCPGRLNSDGDEAFFYLDIKILLVVSHSNTVSVVSDRSFACFTVSEM